MNRDDKMDRVSKSEQQLHLNGLTLQVDELSPKHQPWLGFFVSKHKENFAHRLFPEMEKTR